MNYVIEKSIPLPAKKSRSPSYPFAQLYIGDSFLIPIAAGKSPSGIYAAVSQAKKRLNICLITARVEGGIRVWRIAPSPQANAEASDG